MRCSKLCFATMFFGSIFLSVNAARADLISFSWQSTITPSSIPADQAGISLGLVGVGGAAKYYPYPGWNNSHGVGATYMPVRYYNATYSDKPFTLTLKLTDGRSGMSDVLAFHGFVSGGGYALPSVFYSDGYRSTQIGQEIYRIHMQDGQFLGFEPYPYSDLFAEIDASPASTTPEPSSLLLTVIALPMLGFARRKKPVQG